MVKIGLMSKVERDKYLTAENKAYDQLIKKGYRPQGVDKNFKNVVIFKIENEHTNYEKKEIFYFENWQEANLKLQ